MTTAVIVNPRAGGGSAAARWPRVRSALEAALGTVEVRTTQAPGHAITLARELAAAGVDVIIAAGGDGTVNEVANGILTSGRDACLALLPLATGGDFARGLGLNRDAAALKTLQAGKWRRIDAVRARFAAAGGPMERYFINVASLGLGGEVAARVGRSKLRLPGTFKYLCAAVPCLAAGSVYSIAISVDDAPQGCFRATLAALGNARYQGGGIRIAPGAELDDGLVDVTVVERIGLGEVLRNIHLLYWGDVRRHPKVRSWQAARVRIEGSDEVPVELDGEALGHLPLEAAIVPRALRLMCE